MPLGRDNLKLYAEYEQRKAWPGTGKLEEKRRFEKHLDARGDVGIVQYSLLLTQRNVQQLTVEY